MLTGFSRGPSEDDLSLADRGDDREALFRRHYPAVYSLCLRIVGREDQAHDCAQDTFLRLLRAGASYEDQGRPASWLLRVATRLAIDLLRRRRREPTLPDADDRPTSPPLEETIDIGRVRAGIARLPAEHRAIVVLRLQQGWAYREIAETLGISENLARVRFFRALQSLRETLR